MGQSHSGTLRAFPQLALSIFAVAAIVLSLFALAAPVRAEHGDAHATEKFVTAVNGMAVSDPRGAGNEFVEVETGDLVTFTINVEANPSAAITVSDVYKKNQFEFVSATGTSCGAPADVAGDTKVDCTLTTNTTGEATLTLTFRVLAEGSSGEGCPTITNTAHVSGGGESLSDVAQVKVCNEPDLNVVKRDDDARALAGVSFTLTPQGGTPVTLMTNAQGMINFADVGSGTFTLTEAAPVGCVGIGTLTVVIANDGSVTVTNLPTSVTISGDTLTVVNTCGSPLNLVKRNQSGTALAGVSFTLTASGQTTGTTLATNAQGMLTFPDLDPGSYTLTEAAPAGCTGIGSITLSIAANGTVTLSAANAAVVVSGTPANTLTITNNCPSPTGTLSLLKVDNTAAAATRAGAVFTLTRSGFSATATTVAAGTASFAGLLQGDYSLAETTAPTGCTGLAGSITIRVAADGSVSTVGTLPTGVTFTSGTATLRVVNTCPVQQAVLGGNPTPTPTPVVRQGTLAGSLPNTAMEGPMTELPVIFLALLAIGSLGYLGRRNLVAVTKRR